MYLDYIVLNFMANSQPIFQEKVLFIHIIQRRGSLVRELEQQRKGRNKNTIIDYNYISSNRYRKKFDYISNDKKLNKLLYKIAKKMLLHRSGTEYEDMYWIDLINGKIVCKITDSKYKKKILYTTTIKKMIKKSENLLTIHTHPDSFPPSIDDINSNYDHNYEIGIVI